MSKIDEITLWKVFEVCKNYAAPLMEAQVEYKTEVYLSDEVTEQVCEHFRSVVMMISDFGMTDSESFKEDLEIFWQETVKAYPFSFRFGPEGDPGIDRVDIKYAYITRCFLHWVENSREDLNISQSDLFQRRTQAMLAGEVVVWNLLKYRLDFGIKYDNQADEHWKTISSEYWNNNDYLEAMVESVAEILNINSEIDEKSYENLYALFLKNMPSFNPDPVEEFDNPESYSHLTKPITKIWKKHRKRAYKF